MQRRGVTNSVPLMKETFKWARKCHPSQPLTAPVIWQLGDVGVGITAWINVIALLLLCPHAIRALKDYEKSLKEK